jgi:hypothetical protein
MGQYDIGSLPKSQAKVMNAYNNALQAGAEDKGGNYVTFKDEENWQNTVASLGLDIKAEKSGKSEFYAAINKREQMGLWQNGAGYINFARIFAILDKAGIVEKKSMKSVKESSSVTTEELNAAWEVIARYRVEEFFEDLKSMDEENTIEDAAGSAVDLIRDESGNLAEEFIDAVKRLYPKAIIEAVTTPAVAIWKNQMVRVFQKGTNKKVDTGLVQQVTAKSIFIGSEEYAKDGYDFMILG